MATVQELSDPYANFMVNPLTPDAEDACATCLTFTQGYPQCVACSRQPQFADAVLPISYSTHLGQLHTALANYKRSASPAIARRAQLELAALLWRFLAHHEECVRVRLDIDPFELVTTVPSGAGERDSVHPLREIVGSLVAPTRDRYEPVLRTSGLEVPPRVVNPLKYEAVRDLAGQSVLLIDDTWTTGASAESAAGALKASGAGTVGVVVIGRHLHPEFGENRNRLRALPRLFDWVHCAFE